MATSSDTSEQNNVKSRRPAESAFKQQRLPAWQPILTAGTVLPTFFVIGIAFIPVGIGLLYFSDEVKEHVIDYTWCTSKDANISCADYIKQSNGSNCSCEIPFNLTEDFKADVYLYYGLSNYYQNHRRYVKSRDDNQLLGRLGQPLSSDCDPFAYAEDKKPIAPCGAIANSLFNDTLTLYSVEQNLDVPVHRTGIAWESDKNIKFRNPDHEGELKIAFQNYTKPANWQKHVWELDPEIPSNNGFQNEDLIVWMRTAALPTFRKLYRRIDHEKEGFRKGLNKGPYIVKIKYNYPVTDFDGTKSFVISTTSLLGGKNPFLGVAYVVVGTLCLVLGIVLLIIHVRCSKRYSPHTPESSFLDSDSQSKRNSPHPINRTYLPYNEELDSRTKLSENSSASLPKRQSSVVIGVENVTKVSSGSRLDERRKILEPEVDSRLHSNDRLNASPNAGLSSSLQPNPFQINTKQDQQRLATQSKTKQIQQQLATQSNTKQDQQYLATQSNIKQDQQHLATQSNPKQDQQHFAIQSNPKQDQQHLATQSNIKQDQQHFATQSNIKQGQQHLATQSNIKQDQQHLATQLNATQELQLATPSTETLNKSTEQKGKDEPKKNK